MRILLLNPNTMPEMTALVARVVQPYLPAQAELVPITGRFGAQYIASRSAGVIAAHAALEAFAEHGQGCDGVYLACFGDPGLLAAREIARGMPLSLDRDNDKNPVVALREIAEETQSADDLRERMIESHQTQIEVDEPEDDQMSLLMGVEADRPVDDDMSEEKLLRALMQAQEQG